MLKLKLTSFFALAFVLGACAKVNQKSTQRQVIMHDPGVTASEVNQTSIQGKWQNVCTQDVKTKAYYKATLTFQNAAVTNDIVSYRDEACTSPLTEEISTSSFQLLSAAAPTTPSDLNETLLVIQFKPLSTAEATRLNQQNYCKIKTWAVNQVEAITNFSDCSGMNSTLLVHVQLFGSKEIYLSDCANSTDTNCTNVHYVKAAL